MACVYTYTHAYTEIRVYLLLLVLVLLSMKMIENEDSLVLLWNYHHRGLSPVEVLVLSF